VIVRGWVTDIEGGGGNRARLKILVHDVAGETGRLRFARLYVSEGQTPTPGRPVRCRALLRPPEGPLAPGGYDSARAAYYQRVGAIGFVLSVGRHADLGAPPSLRDRWMLKLAATRRDLTETIWAMVPSEGGAVAVSLITGDRTYMSAASTLAYRDSGLGHFLSVSGLHMALVAGGVFSLLHALFALIEPLALRFPIRKWAAAAALVASALYLAVSGASVPAQRSFIMTAIALGAVLFDRPAFTLRALGVAAIAVVLLAPETAVDPGFQMSFAATAALIAAFEQREHHSLPRPPGWLLGGVDALWRSTSSMLLASVVAGLATDPFALMHFQRITVYGLASNLTITPIVTLAVAPVAIVAALAAPFGLAEWPLRLMAAALDLVTGIGGVFAGRPEAVRYMPAPPQSAFLCAVAALVWACLWRGALRWLAVLWLGAAIMLYVFAPQPRLWADGDLHAVLVRTENGWVLLKDQQRAAFAAVRVGALAGLGPQQVARTPPPPGCPPEACRLGKLGGRPVLFVSRPEGWEHACAPGAIVLAKPSAPADFRARCKPFLLADPAERARRGGLSVTLVDGRTSIRRAGAVKRAWSGALTRSGG
jgi:competence protein ComEC